MITTISKSPSSVTLINVFTVSPENQNALVELLVKATADVMRHLPGFISANIHRSIDRNRVTNYAQWRSVADFEAMLKNPAVIPHTKEAAALAIKFEPALYQVVEVCGPGGDAA